MELNLMAGRYRPYFGKTGRGDSLNDTVGASSAPPLTTDSTVESCFAVCAVSERSKGGSSGSAPVAGRIQPKIMSPEKQPFFCNVKNLGVTFVRRVIILIT